MTDRATSYARVTRHVGFGVGLHSTHLAKMLQIYNARIMLANTLIPRCFVTTLTLCLYFGSHLIHSGHEALKLLCIQLCSHRHCP